MENRKVPLRNLNPLITCYLCKGYLIDAFTVTECMHAFCKSCLVVHLQNNNTCPKCEIVIHQSHPLNYVMQDRSLQDIVYKLVPNLFYDEMERREEFHRARNLPFENPLKTKENEENCNSLPVSHDNHVNDEQISICIRSQDEKLKNVGNSFVCCSSQATICTLKKYLAFLLFGDVSLFSEFDILCNSEVLGKDHSLMFISRTRWRNEDPPLQLFYRKHIEL